MSEAVEAWVDIVFDYETDAHAMERGDAITLARIIAQESKFLRYIEPFTLFFWSDMPSEVVRGRTWTIGTPREAEARWQAASQG